MSESDDAGDPVARLLAGAQASDGIEAAMPP